MYLVLNNYHDENLYIHCTLINYPPVWKIGWDIVMQSVSPDFVVSAQ